MRQDSNAITDIDRLKDWFYLCQTKDETKPYFTVYRGSEAKPDRTIYRNTEISDVDDAWTSLESIIEMHSEHGGLFRIYITNKPGFNVGLNTLYKAASAYGPQQNGVQMAGIYGMYNNPRDLVEQEVARERKLWELEQQIKEMRAESDAKVGEMDQMLQEFTPILKDLAHKFGMKMMGFGPGTAMPAPSPQPIGNPNTDIESYDYDRLDPALDTLRTVIPDVETNIEKLAKWAQNNPEMARQMLQNI